MKAVKVAEGRKKAKNGWKKDSWRWLKEEGKLKMAECKRKAKDIWNKEGKITKGKSNAKYRWRWKAG